jgi:hypothetical protein
MPRRHTGEWRYSSTIFTSVLDGGEWSALRPSCITPWGRTPGRNRILAIQPVARRYIDRAFSATQGRRLTSQKESNLQYLYY